MNLASLYLRNILLCCRRKKTNFKWTWYYLLGNWDASQLNEIEYTLQPSHPNAGDSKCGKVKCPRNYICGVSQHKRLMVTQSNKY